jgi:hypothetical protein
MPLSEAELRTRCRDCQRRLAAHPERAAMFAAEHPECRCDKVSISAFSPGPVGNEEILVRFVVDPKHVNPDGTIEVGFFHDASRNGLSLSRRRYLSDNKLHESGNKYLESMQAREDKDATQKGRDPTLLRLAGLVSFSAGQVRSHQIDGERRFCLTDSARREERFHADIMFNGDFTKKSVRSKLREELRKTVLGKVEPLLAAG